MKLSEFLQDIGKPIAYYPKMRRLTGSTTATIFLCQFVYWTGKEASRDGWIYKTSEDIEEETGLSYEEQKTAREKLKSAGLIQEKYARLEHMMYYRVCLDVLDEKWQNGPSGIPEQGNAQLGKATSPCSLISNTENTTKNTTPEPQKETASKTEAIKKGDMLDGELAYAREHASEQAMIDAVCKRIERGLGVTPNFGKPKWETVIKGIIKREKNGQSLDDYARWCKTDKYNAPKIAQIATNPLIILETWVAAFPDGSAPARQAGRGPSFPDFDSQGRAILG